MDQHGKLLTISIAAYNAESSLERTLASLAACEDVMSSLDIIIVDDGSADSTPVIADTFASEHPESVRVIHKSNGGYGSTVNTSIAAAKGRYFKLLDGDDEADAEGLRGLIRCIADPDLQAPDIILSPFTYVDRSAGAAEAICDRHPDLQTVPVRLEDASLSDGLMMFEMCVRTEVLREAGIRLTENCFYTDNEYVMAAELGASSVMRYPLPVYRYSIGVSGQSMSVAGRRAHMDDKLRAARGVYSIYESSGRQMEGSRKLITDKLLSTMTREVYVSCMLQDSPLEYRDMLREWDREVSERWPDIFEITGKSRLVRTVRAAGDTAYRILCRHVLDSEMKRLGEENTAGQRPASDRPYIKAAEYIAAACMIIQCRTVYMHLQNYGMIVNRTVWVIMMAALAVCIYRCTDRRSSLLTACGVTVYAAVFLAVNPVNYLRVIRCAAAVLMMLVLTGTEAGRKRAEGILRGFRDLMVIIAGVSLICWFMLSVAKILPFTGTAYMDWSPTGEFAKINSFLGIYFETQWTDFTVVSARNSGIFVEGPMMGFACAAALMTELFMNGAEPAEADASYKGQRQRRHIFKTAVLSAAVLSTMSIISYGALFLIYLTKLITAAWSGRTVSRQGKLIAAAGIAAASCLMAYFIIHKLSLPDGNTRINDFAVGFNAWLAHPFFGGGFESLEYLQQFMPEWRSFDTGFSNSPMEILAQGGIYLAVPYVYAFIKSLAQSVKFRDLNRLAATVVFAYLFTFTVVPYQYIAFFVIILLSGDIFSQKTGKPARGK